MHHHLDLKIKELVWNSKHGRVLAESFVFEPSRIEEEELGNLYVVARVLFARDRNATKSKLEFIASLLRREFYARHKEQPRTNFENALRRANVIIEEMRTAGDLQKMRFDIFVVNLRGLDLQFSRSGNIHTALLRGNEIIDIAKKASAGRAVEKKTFDTIATGTLRGGDLLMLSTANISDFMRPRTLSALFGASSFGAFLREVHDAIRPKTRSEINQRESYAFLLLHIAQPQTATEKENKDATFLARMSKKSGAAARFSFGGCVALTKRIVHCPSAVKGFLGSVRATLRRAPRAGSEMSAVGAPPDKTSRFIKRAAVLLLFVSVFSIGALYKFYSRNNSLQNNLSVLSGNLRQVFDIMQDTKDREKAQQIVLQAREEAQEILDYFIARDEIKDRARELVAASNDLEDKIFGNTYVGNFIVESGFTYSLFSLNPKSILLKKGLVMTFGDPLSLYHIYDTREKKGSFSFLNIAPERHMLIARKAGAGILAILDKDFTVHLIDTAISRATQYDIAHVKNAPAPKDLGIYGGNIYFLRPQEGQIFKRSPDGATAPWLKDAVDIGNAVAMHIDGGIHVLSADGTITTLRAGKLLAQYPLGFPQETFLTLQYNETHDVYALLSATNKIYIFDKNWQFVNRFVIPAMEGNIKDFAVDFENNRIFVLADEWLYSGTFTP